MDAGIVGSGSALSKWRNGMVVLSVDTVQVALDRRLGGFPPFFLAPSGMPCLANWNRLVSWSLLLSPNRSKNSLNSPLEWAAAMV